MPTYAYQDTNHPNVIHEDFVGYWTIEEFQKSSREVIELLRQAKPPRTIVADLSQSSGIMPKGILNTSQQIFNLEDLRDVNIIVVKAPSAVRMIVSLMRLVLTHRLPNIRFVDSLTEAYQTMPTS